MAECNRVQSPLKSLGKYRKYGGILLIILFVLILSWFVRPFIRILWHPHREYSALLEEEIRNLRYHGIPGTVEELNLSEIHDEENGARVFRKIFSLIDELAEKYPGEWNYMPHVSPGEWENLPGEERKRVAYIILHDPGFLRIYELTEKAVDMPRRFYPERYYASRDMLEEKWFPEMVSEMARFRGLQRLLVSKARLEAEYGDADEAFAAVVLSLMTAKNSLRSWRRDELAG